LANQNAGYIQGRMIDIQNSQSNRVYCDSPTWLMIPGWFSIACCCIVMFLPIYLFLQRWFLLMFLLNGEMY